MQIIDDILRSISVRTRVNYRVESGEHLAMSFKASSHIAIHGVLTGSCWVGTDGDETVEKLDAGDVVLTSKGSSCWLSYSNSLPKEHTKHDFTEPFIEKLPLGFTPSVTLLGGYIEIPNGNSHPLFNTLPKFTIIRCGKLLQLGPVNHAAYAIDQLIMSHGCKSSPIMDRLFEILLLQLIEAYYQTSEIDYLFLHAMTIPCVAKAIAAIHQEPGYNWTVERLAHLSHTSRSNFSKKFSESVGMPVMHYLTLWRMHKALILLKGGESNLDVVANKVGYISPAAFHKAFKRVHGYTPGKFSLHSM